MSNDALPIALCVLALFFGAMQGRVATLLSRAGARFAVLNERSFGAYTAVPVLVGWLAVVMWAFKSWTWYWVVVAIVCFALSSGFLVNLRTLAAWMVLRVVCTMIVIGAAVTLWAKY